MCFSLINLVQKITNKRGTGDMFAISIHLGTTVTVPSWTKIVVCFSVVKAEMGRGHPKN